MIEQAGRVVYANPAYARLAGFAAPASVIGKKVSSLTIPAGCARDASGNGNNSYGADGPPEFETVRLCFRPGRRPLTFHAVLDITERRRLEQRLRESEKMEALGRLVGGVAHDFNNVLTAISLYSDLLLERTHRRREAEEIYLAAQRGTALVRQLLTFARQQPGTPRVVSLRALTTSLRGMLEPLLGENIELLTQFEADPDTVRLDPAQMQQVIINLAMNARDAMPDGGHLRISTSACAFNERTVQRHPGLRPGPYVALTVTDSGCGMDEHVRRRLFEPFFTTKPAGQGVGLGMSMVYGIVKQSGGTVAVSSKPGKGTRVTIHLPCAPAESHPEPGAGHHPRAAHGTETILLAEDDHAVRASIAHLLTEAGYHVLQARDGEQAARLARAHHGPIDLLICDIVMPGMCGCDAARQVRKAHQETRVLFISGYPARPRADLAGARLLHKPFSLSTLAEKVRETIDHCPPADAAAGLPSRQERELS